MGLIASGGNADVYRAEDERLARQVAVKMLKTGATCQAARAAFAQEAKLAARLWHPNVVAVFDHGEAKGVPFVVMEYVDGRTLRDELNARSRLPTTEALRVCRLVLRGLAAAHRLGIVHRDVKPENVLISRHRDLVKVADFGLSQAVARDGGTSASGPFLATVEYVAPEVVSDRVVGPRCDVYACGVMLYELLTGHVPFEGPQPGPVAQMHLDREVPPPSRVLPGLASDVDAVVRRATCRDPATRPRDAAALGDEVAAVFHSRRQGASRSRPGTRLRAPAARTAWTTAAVLAVLLTLSMWLGWLLAD